MEKRYAWLDPDSGKITIGGSDAFKAAIDRANALDIRAGSDFPHVSNALLDSMVVIPPSDNDFVD